MLIPSKRHTRRDLERWAELERADAVNAESRALLRKAEAAIDEIERFAASGRCYAGTSWGKDSVVLAHLVARLRAERGVSLPLLWIKVDPVFNPDCLLVRDAFLSTHAVDYEEIVVQCEADVSGERIGTGRLETGFAEAAAKHGARHVSGVRGSESTQRRKRMQTYGCSSASTCAPLGWWSAADVYAYLYAHRLPVHPAYACLMNGLLDRDRLRVASLGGERGTGHGRREWELRYYGDEMRQIGER